MSTSVPLDDPLEIGRLVRSARVHAGLTQAELAERLGTRQSVVSRWESGRDDMRVATLARIMRACGLAVRATVGLDDVDRAQIRQQLAMTPSQRLAGVANVSRLVAGAARTR